MVLPLFDDNSDRRRFPAVNYAFIVINVLVFVFPQRMGADDNWFTMAFSTVPYEIVTGKDLEGPYRITVPVANQEHVINHERNPISVYITLLVSMFMHGSVMHLLGNMLFLWIFGDNIEDYLGHFRYVVFYLVCGVLASLAHVGVTYATNTDPLIPSLGASGAISGVLGGYLLLFPQKRVTVLLFRILTEVPAFVAIGLWFLLQILNSLTVLGDKLGGGVAYGAHIGGFVAGLALVKVFGAGRDVPPPSRRYPHWYRRPYG